MKALSARLAMLALLAGLSGCGKGPSKDSRTNSPEKPGRASPVPMSPSAKPDETKSGGTRPRTTIKWLQWGPEAFALAEKQGKPVLLSISVSWSGACRKMDEETFSQPEIVETIQKRYIPIRVDSDERPDINIRYNQGGWPTVVFLSPEGEMLYGGTYYDRSRFAIFLIKKIIQKMTICRA